MAELEGRVRRKKRRKKSTLKERRSTGRQACRGGLRPVKKRRNSQAMKRGLEKKLRVNRYQNQRERIHFRSLFGGRLGEPGGISTSLKRFRTAPSTKYGRRRNAEPTKNQSSYRRRRDRRSFLPAKEKGGGGTKKKELVDM